MDCPKCGSRMQKVHYESIEVDRCTKCGGIWFDEYEERGLKKVRGSEQIDTGDPETGMRYNEIARIDCPVCGVQMTAIVDPKQSHIWYESCPVCYGVFFDAGEFTDYKEETILDFFRSLRAPERQ
jgi:uncharacterized protein